jgi:hypothetical protein
LSSSYNKKSVKEGDAAMQLNLISVVILFLSTHILYSSTFLSGEISGTFCEKNNPIIIKDSCIINTGATCIFGPGCKIYAGDSIGIQCNGTIKIQGTKDNPVILASADENQHWTGIKLSGIGNISYCEFRNAIQALSFLNVSSQRIADCSFIKCSDAGIYMYCEAILIAQINSWTVRERTISTNIQRCSFIDGAGCKFITVGVQGNGSHGGALATINLEMYNCNFVHSPCGLFINNVTCGQFKTAILNNSFSSCDTAIYSNGGSELHMSNILFLNNSYALMQAAVSNSTIDYSCFYNNDSNFIGYSSVYGKLINDSTYGCPRDISFDIFCDPRIKDTLKMKFDSLSPCIDRGDPDSTKNDSDLTVSMGTSKNDIGCNGGKFNRLGVDSVFECDSNTLINQFPNYIKGNKNKIAHYQKINTIRHLFNVNNEKIYIALNGQNYKTAIKKMPNKILVTK